MPSVKEEAKEQYYFEEIYKGSKMGADSIINLLPHVSDDALRSLMTQQLDGYEKYAARAARALEEGGATPHEEKLLARVGARIGMAVHTMIDSTTSHLAEMMVEGSHMSVTEMTKLINAMERCEGMENAMRLAREVIAFEEHNLELLKRFL